MKISNLVFEFLMPNYVYYNQKNKILHEKDPTQRDTVLQKHLAVAPNLGDDIFKRGCQPRGQSEVGGPEPPRPRWRRCRGKTTAAAELWSRHSQTGHFPIAGHYNL